MENRRQVYSSEMLRACQDPEMQDYDGCCFPASLRLQQARRRGRHSWTGLLLISVSSSVLCGERSLSSESVELLSLLSC